MPLNAGQFDRRVIIESSTAGRSTATGAEVLTWATFATVWARVVESATASDEGMTEGVSTYARPTRVTIRYRSDISPKMRINLGSGRLLQIIGTAEVGRREALQMACKEWAHD